MIIRAHRFHGYNALRHVYGRGQTARGQQLTVRYLANPRRGSYRAAVVVSRKVHKSAVVRGRIRRRIYEIIRLAEPDMTGPYDIVVTVFSDQLAAIAAPQLWEMVVIQLQRAGIITGTGSRAATGMATRPAAKPATQQRAIVNTKESAA